MLLKASFGFRLWAEIHNATEKNNKIHWKKSRKMFDLQWTTTYHH